MQRPYRPQQQNPVLLAVVAANIIGIVYSELKTWECAGQQQSIVLQPAQSLHEAKKLLDSLPCAPSCMSQTLRQTPSSNGLTTQGLHKQQMLALSKMHGFGLDKLLPVSDIGSKRCALTVQRHCTFPAVCVHVSAQRSFNAVHGRACFSPGESELTLG